MNIDAIVTTIFGAMLFPFMMIIVWEKVGKEIGIFTAILVEGFVVGAAWLVNHGAGLIVQGQGGAHIDMALAAGIGVIINSILQGGKIKKSLPSIIAAIFGGVIGGFVLASM
ncbi:Lin0368 family putative glycerol transporter subunit [Orenia marismortui]|uniref:Uncharacterized protein n=1 Tax=Orenia marismortui TaxID=46469 RepID=A0A4R8GVG2_9FIRM|nr:hypothetical protein [Orenia marismortui]TDX48973.1 hypothetical protein C7959_12339 [Orenia marismortui]